MSAGIYFPASSTICKRRWRTPGLYSLLAGSMKHVSLGWLSNPIPRREHRSHLTWPFVFIRAVGKAVLAGKLVDSG